MGVPKKAAGRVSQISLGIGFASAVAELESQSSINPPFWQRIPAANLAET